MAWITDIKKFYDEHGELLAVLVPADIWRKYEPEEPCAGKDDMEAFSELMSCWNFRYPYDPSVKCPVCGIKTADWRIDPQKPFKLANANIGGLMVFHCRNCSATIRHKYYRDHWVAEHDPA